MRPRPTSLLGASVRAEGLMASRRYYSRRRRPSRRGRWVGAWLGAYAASAKIVCTATIPTRRLRGVYSIRISRM